MHYPVFTMLAPYEIRDRTTEPPNPPTDRHHQPKQYGTATNIKSRTNRLSVLDAITSTQQRLKLYSKVPPNGLVRTWETHDLRRFFGRLVFGFGFGLVWFGCM